MAKLLSNSLVDRKNILNNPYAVDHIRKAVGVKGLLFDGEYRYTSEQVASFFEVSERTIADYLSTHRMELLENGYELLIGERLRNFKNSFGHEINFRTKTTKLGVFTFKSFINIGMLLVKSEKARALRSFVLDIVIEVVSLKAGGNTKYINQRDDSYLLSLYLSEGYRKEFLEAVKDYVEMGIARYPIYTDKIYNSIFKEKAQEYKQVLDLKREENVRDTMYSEVLTTISMYETGLANEIKKKAQLLNKKLSPREVDELFIEFESNPIWMPQLEMVRTQMASRDYGLRSKLHPKLADYINPLNKEEFERFLGEKSKELAKRIEENQEVFKRLKDK